MPGVTELKDQSVEEIKAKIAKAEVEARAHMLRTWKQSDRLAPSVRASADAPTV
jgi:hypothetical protein